MKIGDVNRKTVIKEEKSVQPEVPKYEDGDFVVN